MTPSNPLASTTERRANSASKQPSITTILFILIASLAGIGQTSADHLQQHALLPLPPAPKLDEVIVRLGHKLFHDPILSGNRTLSCASCHILADGGDDNRPRSYTTANQPRDLNTPSIFNVTHNFRFGLTGAVEFIKPFFEINLFRAKGMNNTWPVILESLRSDQEYTKRFSQNYPDGITKDNVLDALITFQYSLVTPGARFDQYLLGDKNALSDQEKRGYNLFKDYGCTACHQGKNIGGNLFQKFGLFGDYYSDQGRSPNKVDLGRYNITQQEEDRYMFRVPSLRNVAETAPYLHDGSVETLDEIIDIMGRYQIGRTIAEPERKDIAAFLQTLTGKFDGFKPTNP